MICNGRTACARDLVFCMCICARKNEEIQLGFCGARDFVSCVLCVARKKKNAFVWGHTQSPAH